MRSPRYTILLANRNTGAVRRFTFVRRPIILLALGLFAVPTLVGFGAVWANKAELETLRLSNETLRVENEGYRAATGELAGQISALQNAITDLSQQAELDPATRQAIERLPAVVKSRAMGGGSRSDAPVPTLAATATAENTFGLLKDLLDVLDDRLSTVRRGVEERQALAAATPSAWPLAGWLSSNYGKRTDPITGGQENHAGLDISADRGTPVHATADGVVEWAAYSGNYGNCIEISHGFGIGTRFGHLSGYAVHIGQRVKRGDVIGYVGATGRTTGPHLHYEILLNGSPIDPMRFLGWR
jgi:murein DD-endopeptidase MepM/ murein hydrolase activator NlpD